MSEKGDKLLVEPRVHFTPATHLFCSMLGKILAMSKDTSIAFTVYL